METIGAAVIFLLFMVIPMILVGAPLGWAYHQAAPMRAQAALEAAREERARR
jgi:hypothetical protein